MLKIKYLFVILFVLIFSTNVFSRTLVRISMSPFEPFVSDTDPPKGIALDMIEIMNKFQEKYEFQFIMTTSVRRHKAFKRGLFEMSMFDNYNWGWEGMQVDISKVYLRGGEIYVALADQGRGQDFFTDFKNKRMIGMLGYHYGFADFNSDQNFLKNDFNMSFTTNNLGTIKMLLKGRGEIAVVTKSYFNLYLNNNPEMKQAFLVSDIYDQEYNHSIIIRKGIRPSIDEIDTLLEDMEEAGVLKPLWDSIGLKGVVIP